MNGWPGGRLDRLVSIGGGGGVGGMRRPGKKNALGHAFLFQFAPSGHVRSPHAHTHSLFQRKTNRRLKVKC